MFIAGMNLTRASGVLYSWHEVDVSSGSLLHSELFVQLNSPIQSLGMATAWLVYLHLNICRSKNVN